MKPLRIAVVDDEPLARERLSRLLVECDCEVIAELEDTPGLLAWLRSGNRPDALFLDVQMPGGTGLEALAELADPPPVVFITAFSDHAVRAFEAEAVDYILKPVFKDRLLKAVQRLRAHLRAPASPVDSATVQVPLPGAAGTRIAVKAGSGHLLLDLRKVTHFELEEDVIWVWSGGKRFRGPWESIVEVLEAFPAAGLMRIQRNLLLRPETVVGIRSLPGGRVAVRTAEGLELEVSRTMTPAMKEHLGLG